MKHTNYDALFCGHQPIHQINAVQPHGALIVLRKKDLQIVQVSENIERLLGGPPKDVVQKPLSLFCDADSVATLSKKIAGSHAGGKVPVQLSFKTAEAVKHYKTLAHLKGDILLIEVEWQNEISPQSDAGMRSYQQVGALMPFFDNALSVQAVCDLAAAEIKKLSGFGKVMIYAFDEEWSGTVVAEAADEGWELYLGLKFPPSDIPKPAREMYRTNAYRIISTREYEPVPLFPARNEETGTPTDLSLCNLRSVAPVHLHYLKNMDVTASMSIRILHNEQLWGLIACHHKEAKYFSADECAAFEIFSYVVSAKISSLINVESAQLRQKLQQHFDVLMEQVYLFNNLAGTFYTHREVVLRLLSAEGVALSWNDNIYTFGITPDEDAVQRICQWLQKANIRKTMMFAALPYAFEEAKHYADVGSGLLALPLQTETKNFILAFRPEAVQNVSWGGNPEEALQISQDQRSYNPRHSFQVWKEVVRYSAVPWHAEETAIAERLRNAIVEFMLQQKNSELQTAINEFKFVTDFMPQIVWTAAPDGEVDFFNRRWYEYTALPASKHPAEDWLSVIHPADQERTKLLWQEACTQGTMYQIEYRLRSREGAYNWFLGRAIPMRNEGGRIVKWFGTCTDIQVQKETANTLEEQVRARTIDLEKTNSELKAVNEELVNLTFVATHHLQEPARKIQLFSHLIQDKFLNGHQPEASGYINRIIKSSNRIKTLLNDLLLYSTLADDAEITILSLQEIVEEVKAGLQQAIQDKAATITVANDCFFEGRKDQIKLVFRHLIDNALKFCKEGVPLQVHISAKKTDALRVDAAENTSGNYCFITVADNGIGIDERYIPKVFGVFQRLHTQEHSEGSGIGLSIVKKIVEKHSGVIALQSAEGEGTTFTIVLPLRQTVLPQTS